MVANEANSSTVAFIAPGPKGQSRSNVLYVGATYTGKSNMCRNVPAVSSRSLESGNFLDLANIDMTTSTRMQVNSLVQKSYRIDYVYGFSSEGFSYFLTRQRESMKSTAPIISKLVRVCHDDPSYHSYVEVPIKCMDQNRKDYNLVQSAYLSKPGVDLAARLDIQTTDDVLFASFSLSNDQEGKSTANSAFKNALCVYSMKSVRSMFTKNIQKCFTGAGETGLPFIMPSYPCINVVSNLISISCF